MQSEKLGSLDFKQVLKPATLQKLRIEGNMYQKVLHEYIHILPSFLGGKCTCAKCSALSIHGTHSRRKEENNQAEPSGTFTSCEDPSLHEHPYQNDLETGGNCDQVLRTAIIGILMLSIFIPFIGAMYDLDSLPFALIS